MKTVNFFSYVNEPVMSKPDENDGGEEEELVDPDANKSNNAPANGVDINFEKKFKDLEEALGVMGDKHDNVCHSPNQLFMK